MGVGLQAYLDRFLRQTGTGKVLDVQIVPPFHRILEIETKMRDMKDLNELLYSGNTQSQCFIPSKYKDIDKFAAKMEQYDEKLVMETMKPYVPSGHAFVCLDTLSSVEACVSHFKLTPWRYVQFIWSAIRDNCCTCCGLFGTRSRVRNQSSFLDTDDIEHN